MSPFRRLALWVRAAGGLAVILAGTLIFGAIGSWFSRSVFVVTVAVQAPDPATASDGLKRALSAAWPGIDFDTAGGQVHVDVVESGNCPAPAAAVVFRASATRPQFSARFATLPAIVHESGLALCGYGYRSSELGGADVPAQPLRAGVPYLALVLAGVLLWWRTGRGRPPYPAGRLRPGRAMAIGVLTGVAAAAALTAFGLAADALDFRLPTRLEPAPEGLVPQVWLLVLMAVLVPFVEEFAFRAWFLPQATPAVGAAIATVASGVLFSAIHFPAVPAEALALFLFSVALSVLWYRTGSLLACVTTHGVYNAIVFAGLMLD